MKKSVFLRLISAALLLVMTVSILASCKSNKDDDTDADGGETTAPDIVDNVSFLKSDISNFKIVYADGSGDDVLASAETLQRIILNSCGYEPILTNDFIREGSSTFREAEYEILLGETNRKESVQFTETLRQDDYGYTCIGTKILISARDDYALMQAIDSFTAQIVLGKKDSEFFFTSEWASVTKGSYNIDELTLNGKAITEYKIVYPAKSTAFEKQLASKLSLAIADESGYMISIVSDAAESDGTPEILIGSTSHHSVGEDLTERNGYTEGGDGRVMLYGSTSAGNAEAVKTFISDMKSNTSDKACTLNYTDRQAHMPQSETFTAMSFNVLTSDMSSARSERVVSTILRSLPDTFGVQEANAKWITELSSSLGKYYSYIGSGTQSTNKGNEHCAIFYSKERFTLIESNTYWLTDTPTENSVLEGSDYPRVYTYAVLEDKDTGERFMHLNSHLDTANTDIRLQEVLLLMEFLKDYNDIPVIFTGDMNAYADSAEMKTLFANGFIQPVDALGLTSYEPTFIYRPVTLDYVLTTSDSIQVLNYVVESNRIYGDYASDHHAVYITFKLKKLTEALNHGWDDIKVIYPDSSNSDTIRIDGVLYNKISTEEQLRAISENPSRNYILMNDITLSDAENGGSNWTPINDFSGILNGNGFAVKNIVIKDAAASKWATVGFFGTTNGATVKNLTLYGSLTNNKDFSVELAGFVGHTKNGTKLINCISHMDITTGTAQGSVYVGGIVGTADSDTLIDGCKNYGTLSIASSTKSSYAGGIAGYTKQSVTLKNCVNAGSVSLLNADHTAYAAGIIAILDNGDSTTVTLENCTNTGKITSSSRYLAGITCGNKNARNGVINITYCSNTGELVSSYTSNYNIFVGGIIARFNHSTSSVISNCYNGGNMSTSNGRNDNYVGGIGGSEGKTAYTNCVTTAFEGATGTTLFGYGQSVTSTEGCEILSDSSELQTVVLKLNGSLTSPAFTVKDGKIASTLIQ